MNVPNHLLVCGWVFLAWFQTNLLSPTESSGDGEFVGPADWGLYRELLENRVTEPSYPVSFAELWSHPESFRGRVVRVEGRITRQFRQPKGGDFPALIEAWLLDASGNPLCLLFPATSLSETGESVCFEGTFLRIIRYRGLDGDRLAPLILSSAPPTILDREPEGVAALPEASTLEAWIAGMLAVVVIALLGVQHIKRRAIVVSSIVESPPTFLEPDPTHSVGIDGDTTPKS